MPEPFFPHYRDAIRKLDLAQVAAPAQIPETFLLGREGRYSAHYIPFESIHPQARGAAGGRLQRRDPGANAERVAYFLGCKERSALSSRTNGAQIDAARDALMAQMEALMATRRSQGGRLRRPRVQLVEEYSRGYSLAG